MKRSAGLWPARGFLAHRGLITVCAGAAAAEAALLCWLGPPARALAAQFTALPPLAVFHDLRWLYGDQQSWPGFVLLLAALVAARSGLNAAVIRLAWPASPFGAPAPPAREAFGAALSLTVTACVLLSPIAALTVGVAILPFSWPFFGALLLMLLIALPLAHGGAHASWWRALPPLRAMAWLLADFVVLSLIAALIGRLPVAAAIPLAALAGVANARAWYGLARAVAPRAARRAAAPVRPLGRLPLAPVAALLVLGLVVGLTRLAFAVGHGPPQVAAAAALQPGAVAPGAAARAAGGSGVAHRSRHDPVLVILGFGSACCSDGRGLQPVAPGAILQQFSYRGLAPDGQPLPEGNGAGDIPLPQLGRLITAQVLRLHAETGRPVDIIAESEGTLGVDAMLATHSPLPLGAMVMMSPIVTPGQVSYTGGSGTAAGLVPADELRAVVWFVGGLSPFGSSGAQTLISSVDATGARFAAAAARHHPLRWMILVPLADAVTLPVCPLPRGVVVIPALHGDLLGTPAVMTMVREFLAGHGTPAQTRFNSAAELVAAAAAAWRMPQVSPPIPACRR
jgi:hypothetical protein